jgi:hypothetical protein
MSSSRKGSTEILFPKLDMSNCRICFDIGMNPLIQACRCNGSSRFVHEICLKQWITTKYTQLDNAQCEICLYKYTIIIEETSKCSIKNAVPKSVSNLCLIITALSILIALAIFTGLFIKNRMDLKRKKTYSITVLSICGSVMGACFIFLAKGMYKVMVKVTVNKWTIIPLSEEIPENADICS